MNKEESKIVISLHRKGDNELSPRIETVGEVDDFEYLFAIAKMAEVFAKTPDSKANGEKAVIDMISMAVTAGVKDKVDEYVKFFIKALIYQRTKAVINRITESLKSVGLDVVPVNDKRICNGQELVLKINNKEDEDDEG